MKIIIELNEYKFEDNLKEIISKFEGKKIENYIDSETLIMILEKNIDKIDNNFIKFSIQSCLRIIKDVKKI